MAIIREDFAQDCADQAFRFGVITHYLLAVAELLSGINDDSDGDRIGPFRIKQADWNAQGTDPKFELNLQPAHISRPGLQCAFAALQTLRAQEKFKQQNGGKLPNADQLYAIWPNQTPPAGKTLQAALEATRDLVEPAERLALAGLDAGAGGMTVADGATMPSGAGGILGELVGRIESKGNYNAFNRGTAGVSGPAQDFTAMTIGTIMAKQAAKEVFAVGKYQLIPGTMKETVDKLGIAASRQYAPALQEHMFRNYLISGKRRKFQGYITGKHNDINGAQFDLANEFASLPDPKTGNSVFAGKGGNKALVSTAEVQAAMNAEREKFAELVKSGKSEADAWTALSPGLVG